MPKPRRKPATPYVPPEPAQKPPPEAMAHGDYTQGSSGSRSVWTNQKPCMILALKGSGSISAKQAAAGLAFEVTYHRVWGSPSHRDSTQRPIGGEAHETERQAEAWAKASARLNTILNRVGPKAYSQLVSVVVFNEPVGTYRDNSDGHEMLRSALDQCAIAYGVDA